MECHDRCQHFLRISKIGLIHLCVKIPGAEVSGADDLSSSVYNDISAISNNYSADYAANQVALASWPPMLKYSNAAGFKAGRGFLNTKKAFTDFIRKS